MRTLIFLAAVGIGLGSPSFAAQGVVTPPQSIVADNLPPIPASIAESVGRYTEFRAASFRSWHPTRREMLIRTRFANTMQLHLVKMPLGARSQITFFTDSVAGGSFQPTTGDYFIFNKDSGGNEFSQIYRYDFASGQVTLLTDGKSRNSAGIWNRAGDLIAYTSTRRNRKDADIYVMNPADPQSDKMVWQSESPGWEVLDFNAGEILLEHFVSINESSLYKIDLQSSKRSMVTPEQPAGEKVAWSGGELTPDGRVLTVTDQGSEFARLAIIGPKGRAIDEKRDAFAVEYLSPGLKWDVEAFAASDDGKFVAYVTNEDGVAIPHLIDLVTRRTYDLPQLPAGRITTLDWHKDCNALAITLTSARSPSDVFVLDCTPTRTDPAKSPTLQRWTQSETAGLNTAQFVEPTLVRWKSFDGKEISGFLYAPDAGKFPGKRPVIVNIHGGPEGQFRPQFLGEINYYLNVMGLAVVFPNVRGSAGYGKTFLTLDNGKLRQDSVKDIGALLDWIKTRPDLDADRIMITGGSYGGFMTLACSVQYADRIRCSVDVVGISNFVTFLQHTEPYRQDLRRAEYGDERDPDMREFLLKISPLTNVAKITRPILIVQGANDPRVPRTEADQMVEKLKKQGTEVSYLLARDEGHGFAKKGNSEYQFYSTVAFIKRHLLP